MAVKKRKSASKALPREFKSPFTIYVLWHPDFAKGQQIADFIYSNFSRDISSPLARNAGIPVFFRSKPAGGSNVPLPIPLAESDYNAIVVIVDNKMFLDRNWENYVAQLETSASTRIFPVATSASALQFLGSKLKTQFIKAEFNPQAVSQEEFDDLMWMIRSRLLHAFCRLLLNTVDEDNGNGDHVPAPVQLFISHAKKDGEQDAKRFKNFVDTTLKVKTFFDANDIADGHRFDTQLRKAVEDRNAALVVFHSDVYATREWCQIEVLTAKRHKTPIVVVLNVMKGEKRSFPYLGNVPTIRLKNDNFNEIVDLTLFQILINVFQMLNLRKTRDFYLQDKFDGVELSSPPELLNFIDIMKTKKESGKKDFIVLYPDPPIGTDELTILNDMQLGIKFLTPVQLSGLID